MPSYLTALHISTKANRHNIHKFYAVMNIVLLMLKCAMILYMTSNHGKELSEQFSGSLCFFFFGVDLYNI